MELESTYMVKIKNPLIVGSGSTTHTPEMCEKAAKCGWSAVILKTFFSESIQKTSPMRIRRPQYALTDARGLDKWKPIVPRVTGPRRRGGKFLGKIQPDYWFVSGGNVDPGLPDEYRGVSPTFYNTPDSYLWYINRTKELCERFDCKVIASIASFHENEWEIACDVVNRSSADAVELNFGCPTVGAVDEKTGKWIPGIPLGFYPEYVKKWVKFCGERIKNIPVGMKLPPSCPDPLGAARAGMEAGIKGVQFADARPFSPPIPPLAIDIEKAEAGVFPGLPYSYPVAPSWTVGFVCGVLSHFRLNGIGIDLSGCGGVRSPVDVIRILMAGGTSVQVVVATMVEGLEIGDEYIQEITSWMERHGYKSIKDVQSLVATKEKLSMDLTKAGRTYIPHVAGGPLPKEQVKVNEKRCINCGWCESCCLHLAIKIADELPSIDRDLCEVCGMCVAVCPMGALSIV